MMEEEKEEEKLPQSVYVGDLFTFHSVFRNTFSLFLRTEGFYGIILCNGTILCSIALVVTASFRATARGAQWGYGLASGCGRSCKKYWKGGGIVDVWTIGQAIHYAKCCTAARRRDMPGAVSQEFRAFTGSI
ncbi:hypothetical protein RRG08_015295 [Elysia crispata]|uniref:Uncharacterized protein n=1 Tax=Elysia crispata TaxID=231223 RepID=A0AAE0ZTP9_9GAST|nr:hypothetical protein RRG08_015295 [Elysia crispata]